MLLSSEVASSGDTLKHTAIHCNTLQHTATHCNTLQHTATHCSTLHHAATRRRVHVWGYHEKQSCQIKFSEASPAIVFYGKFSSELTFENLYRERQSRHVTHKKLPGGGCTCISASSWGMSKMACRTHTPKTSNSSTVTVDTLHMQAPYTCIDLDQTGFTIELTIELTVERTIELTIQNDF